MNILKTTSSLPDAKPFGSLPFIALGKRLVVDPIAAVCHSNWLVAIQLLLLFSTKQRLGKHLAGISWVKHLLDKQLVRICFGKISLDKQLASICSGKSSLNKQLECICCSKHALICAENQPIKQKPSFLN